MIKRPDRVLADKWRLVMIIAALCLAWTGQTRLDRRFPPWQGWLLLAISAGFVFPVVSPPERWRGQLRQVTLSRPVLLWVALAMCVPAWIGFSGNQIRWWALACWLAALCCAMAAASDPGAQVPQGRKRHFFAQSLHLTWPCVVVLLAIALGALLRFHELHGLPADLGWDLPYNYSDAERILRGEHLVFFPDNYGREGIFFYAIVAVAKVLGLSAYSIRVTSALIGLATIGAVFGLGRACYDDEVGAMAAMALAVNRWHVTLTRSGYRVSLMPLFCILALTSLAWALCRGRARDWAKTGLYVGLGLMTYKAFTFAAVTVLALVAVYSMGSVWRSRGSGHTMTRLVGPLLLVTLLGMGALPIIRVVIEEPEIYLAREMHGGDLVAHSIETEGITRSQLYASNLLTSARMFNEVGDGNPRFGVPFQRQLGLASAVFLVFGLALAVRARFQGPYGLLCFSLAGLVAPMTVSMLWQETPNCFRSSGVLGVCMVLGSAALVAIARFLPKWIASHCGKTLELRLRLTTPDQRREQVIRFQWRKVLVVAVWLGVFGVGLYELQETRHDYFVAFRSVAPDIGNYSVAQALADRIIEYDLGPAYIKVWPYWYDGRAVQEHLGSAERTWDGEFVELDPNLPPLRDHMGPVLILMHPDDSETLSRARQYLSRSAYVVERYPNGMPALLALYGER